jgi:hypothetical protein
MTKIFQVLGVVVASLVVVAFWRSPSTGAADVGEVVGWTVGVLQAGVERFADVVGRL